MITSIRLQNFRSWREASFEFGDSANIVVGPNASGKTNLLEAVMMLAQGSSYRAKDADLIRHGAPWARLDGFFADQPRVLKLEAAESRPVKTFEIGGQSYHRLSLERSLPLVFFEPEHLQAITRRPDGRRDFFDDLLSRSQPGFRQSAAGYRRALAQRNALLKSGRRAATGQMFAWNVRLGELASKIAAARAELCDSLNKEISKTYGQIAGKKTKVSIRYDNQFPVASYASQMVGKLEKSLASDLERGFTGCGPHREDFIFFIDGRDLGLTGSRGEVRSLLLALKKMELGIIELAHGQKPLLLLDDVLSELDGARRQALVNLLKDYQSILTTTDADAVMNYFAAGPHRLLALK